MKNKESIYEALKSASSVEDIESVFSDETLFSAEDIKSLTPQKK